MIWKMCLESRETVEVSEFLRCLQRGSMKQNLPRLLFPAKLLGIVIVFLLFGMVACQPSASKRPQASQAIKGKYGKANRYFYYLLSQLKVFEEKDVEAYEFLNLALEKDPESAFLWNQKAYFEAKLGQINQSYTSVKTALEKNPNDIDSLILMAKLLTLQDKAELAVTYYQRALELDPENEEAYNLLARDYLILNESRRAIQTLNTCVSRLPESLSCLYYLGTIHLEAERYNQALKYLNLIAQLNPEQEKVLHTIGEIYIKKGDVEKALETFKQISQQNPTDLVSQIRTGLLYYQLKKIDEAIAEFEKVSQRFPESDKVNYFLGLLYLEKKDLKTAYQYFDRITSQSAYFREAFNRQLLILRDLNALDQGVALVDEKFTEKTPEFYQVKASLYVLQDQFEEALSILNKGIKKNKADEKMLFQRAVILDKVGRWNEARKDLEMIVSVNPENVDALNFIGYTLADRNEDLELALEYVKKALALDPNEGHVIDSLGWVYYKMGNVNKALELIHKAVKLEPEEPTIIEHLGDVYLNLKNKRKARYYYQKALQLLKGKPQLRQDEREQIREIEEKLAEF